MFVKSSRKYRNEERRSENRYDDYDHRDNDYANDHDNIHDFAVHDDHEFC